MSLRFNRGLIPPTQLKYGEPFYIPGLGILIGNEEGKPEQISGSGGAGLLAEKFTNLQSGTINLFHATEISSLIVVQNGLILTQENDYTVELVNKKYQITLLEYEAADLITMLYSPIDPSDEEIAGYVFTDLVAPVGELLVGVPIELETTIIPGAKYTWYVDDLVISYSQKLTFAFETEGVKNIKCVIDVFGTEFVTNILPLTITSTFGSFRVPDFTTEYLSMFMGNAHFTYSSIVGNVINDFWYDVNNLLNGVNIGFDLVLKEQITDTTVEKGYKITFSGFDGNPIAFNLSLFPMMGTAGDPVYQPPISNTVISSSSVDDIVRLIKFKLPASSGIIVDRFLFAIMLDRGAAGSNSLKPKLKITMEEVDPATIV